VESTSRRRIRQWPSLLLQLASIACLLLALSQLRIGSPDTSSRDHVLLIDTSSWMAAIDNNRPLIEQARQQALAYARAIPPNDRLMVAYADAMATPATAFETDRRKIEAAIRNAKPSSSALDLRQALGFARLAQSRGAKRGGEIVFAGAGRMLQREGAGDFQAPDNLRVLSVAAAPENVGIRKIGLRRSTAEADLWNIYIGVRNYGRAEQQVDLAVQFGGAPAGSRQLRVAAGSEHEAAFEYRTRAAGLLEARIRARRDGFPGDDRAVLELPAQPVASVLVCSDEPALLKPLLDAHPSVSATYAPTARCGAVAEGSIGIYDRVGPAQAAKRAIYLDPPPGRSPVPVSPATAAVTLDKWLVDHPVAAGLRTRDFRIDAARVFTPATGDARVAESAAGPVIVARPGLVAFGFHPMRSALRYELATPLLFANALRWLAPESFRSAEVFASAVGSVAAPLESDPGANVEVRAQDGSMLPFTVSGNSIRFFSGRPGTVRVKAGSREQIHSLTLPDVPEQLWEIPKGARRGVPRAREWGSSSRDIWYWLAILGGIGLLVEWLLFAPTGPRQMRRAVTAPSKAVESRAA
jgi:hypothetical protein